MRTLRDVEGVLAVGERPVRAAVRARDGWLLLTNSRLLMLGASRHDDPPRVLWAEPLDQIEVTTRWLWWRFDHRLVIRSTGGRVAQVGLKRTAGQSSASDRGRALRKLADDIRRWAEAGRILAARASQPDAGLEHDRVLPALGPHDHVYEICWRADDEAKYLAIAGGTEATDMHAGFTDELVTRGTVVRCSKPPFNEDLSSFDEYDWQLFDGDGRKIGETRYMEDVRR